MNNIIIAAIIGFSLGAAGYIVFRFWLLPIGRYQRIKDQITEKNLRMTHPKTFWRYPVSGTPIMPAIASLTSKKVSIYLRIRQKANRNPDLQDSDA
ncbi:MAG: hypothetical protein NTU74_19685 [Deltaproteobacteria bacterium]|nr:hypothetical protein [Deltaproteobacteria bacterium]